MMWLACTPVAGVTDTELIIADKDVFLQEKKDAFDMHFVVKILHGKFRFLKKEYFFDSQKNNIKKFKFAMSEKGCGSASIEFDYIDAYVQPEDIVQLYALDKIVYQGRVSNIEGTKIDVQPARAKLSELRYYGKFDKNYTALEIIKKILDEKNLDSGVEFNVAYIDNDFYEKIESYYMQGELVVNYETVSNVIDNIMTEIDSDAIWGVNEIGAFFVKYPESNISQFFYQTQARSDYQKITVSENWDGIEYTRAAVTRAGRVYTDEEKEANPALIDEGDSVFCGVVGYESTPDYPVLSDLENLVGKKEALINLSTMLTNDTTAERNKIALDYAYTMLKSQLAEKKITLTKVPFRPDMTCSQKAYIQATDNSFLILSDCSSTAGWDRATLTQTASVAGDSHIIGKEDMTFYLDRDTQYREQAFFVFCAKFSCTDIFTVDFRDSAGKTLFSRRYQINSRSWQQITIPYTKSFCSIRFHFPGSYELDMLQVYCLNDKVYNLNISQITTEIKGGIGLSQVELGSRNVTANDRLQYLEWKFKQIEAINAI